MRRLQRLGWKRSWSDRRSITAFNTRYREQSHEAPVIIAGAAVNPRTRYPQYRFRAIPTGQPAQYHSLRLRNGLHDTDIRRRDGTERASCECDDLASGVGCGSGIWSELRLYSVVFASWQRKRWYFFRRGALLQRSANTVCLCKTSHEMYGWHNMGRNSSVGIAIRYGLDGPGIESR